MTRLKYETENPLFSNLPDSIDKIGEVIDSFKQRRRDKYWLRNLNPSENYVDRDFDIILDILDIRSGKKYEVFITKIANHGAVNKVVGSCKGSQFFCRRVGRQFDELIFRATDEGAENPQWLPTSSSVWLKLLDDGPNGFREFVYYSPDLRSFKYTVAPRSWEFQDCISRSVDTAGGTNRHVQTITDADYNFFDPTCDFDRYFLPRSHKLYDALSALAINLTGDGADVIIKPGSNIPIEVCNVFFGPFDYGRSLIKGGRQKTVHQNSHASSQPSLRHISLQALKAA